MLNKILLATNNSHKQEKLRWVLGRYFKQIDIPKTSLDIEEEGNSFEEIAKKKALEASINYNGFSIATDGGMEIPVLGNSWDSLFTKRFVGKENVTDFDRMDTLLELMKDKKDRRMRWEEAVAIAYKGRIVFSTTVEGAKGVLQTNYDPKKYKEGIWLCSLWYFPTYKKNFFDLKPKQRNFAEVSWFRIKRNIGYFFEIPFSLRMEKNNLLGKVETLPAFTLENWPKDYLMEIISEKASPVIKNELKKNRILLDERDLKYQVLFFLTTYSILDLFGERLEDHLIKKGIFKDWKNLLNLERKQLSKFRINKTIVEKVTKEQIQVSELRLKNTSLPIRKILKPRNEIFSTKGWVIEKTNGNIFAVNGKKKKQLEFLRVNKEYARALHSQLHYIHCDRVQNAFGLFIKGQKIPFSVLGIEKIDREYKKIAVLLKGYDYNNVVDFTRLYSFPNSPMNTSSVMFSLTRDYLRKNTKVQAALSAFMPSYANGMSMFAGGLDTVLIAKPLTHRFKKVPKTNLYKHIVKRIQNGNKNGYLKNKIPLLPTLELLSSITRPPLEPNKELDGKMIDLTKYF